MTAKQDFLIRCLSVISVRVKVILGKLTKELKQTLELSRASTLPTYLHTISQLRETNRTLKFFHELLVQGVHSLQHYPGLLPGLSPVFMILYAMLPLDNNILEELTEDFIRVISSDPYIAKKFDEELTAFLMLKYETEATEFFMTAYFKKEKQNPKIRIIILDRVLSEVLFNNNSTVKHMVIDDIVVLKKQLGVALVYPHRQYGKWSHPQSKTQLSAKIIRTAVNPLKVLKLALVLPWCEAPVGQASKILAFYAAAWVMHLLNPQTTPCPPPVHRSKDLPPDKKPLMEQAERLFSSAMGEVYSPYQLMSLIQKNGFENVQLYECDSTNYLTQLKKVIDQGDLALVYFDVSWDTQNPSHLGLPCARKGVYEHSAIVWGYGIDQNDGESFFVYHGDSYYKFSAKSLLNSTQQLQRTEGETFYDLNTNGAPFWVEKHKAREFFPELWTKIKNKEYRGCLFTFPLPKNLPGFRNCIISFGSNPEPQQQLRPGLS